jgi:hypothetical protein
MNLDGIMPNGNLLGQFIYSKNVGKDWSNTHFTSV